MSDSLAAGLLLWPVVVCLLCDYRVSESVLVPDNAVPSITASEQFLIPQAGAVPGPIPSVPYDPESRWQCP